MSVAVLLDTDVFSFLAKNDTRGAWYASRIGGSERASDLVQDGCGAKSVDHPAKLVGEAVRST